MIERDYQIIVIGAGHAGCEAAHIAAKKGYQTILITQNLDTVAKMSCNPSIGGIAKGHLVREIDALGGIMARIIDRTMIQFRMLNTKKGPAVQAMRAQADKLDYHVVMKKSLENMARLDLFQDTVTELLVKNNRIYGVKTARGNKITARSVVLTTGTFMEGKIHIGEYQALNGRLDEPAVIGLSRHLKELSFQIGRLKTGTPARVTRRSIDFNLIDEQIGDAMMLCFSNYSNQPLERPNHACYITYTNEKTHQIIRDNFQRSPLFGGKIKGVGPRYCPSIEDKVRKFPEKTRHQIFVEPEGLYTNEIYLNGLSSSLPEDVQEKFLKTIVGFKNIEIIRPAYAVEYDYLNPIQLKPSLETKLINGLFIAGQTNGTSGYEEAAAQGLIAGINAFLALENHEPLVLGRDQAYIGVLIDDLITQGTNEPYRMFTSRAEYRLKLRQDNTDLRLSDIAIQLGLLSEEEKNYYQNRKNSISQLKACFKTSKLDEEESQKIGLNGVKKGTLWENYLKNPAADFFKAFDLFIEKQPQTSQDAFLTAAIEVKYQGYINRQDKDIEKSKKLARRLIPDDIDYETVLGLSSEGKEKLIKVRPATLGQALRISGVTPADVSLLSMYIHSHLQQK